MDWLIGYFNNTEFVMKAEIVGKGSAGVSRYCTIIGLEFGSGFWGGT
jgi:hypothetical protein